MAVSGPAILSGSWSIAQIAAQQSHAPWIVLVQPLGFFLALTGLIGKLKRAPFDIPKAKSEVGAGPLTEFSGRKLALWQLSLHIKTAIGIFLLINLFLGGIGSGSPVLTLLVFGGKSLLVLLVLSLVDVLYARLRIDQLVNLGWRVLAPLALVQVLVVILIGVG
jgi:NADH-quinone oxidoreductase subunit H